MRVFISAGEASGDAYGAALVHEMARLADPNHSLNFEGIGGSKMKAEKVDLVCDSSKWGAISIIQGIRIGVGVLFQALKAKRFLKKGTPGLMIAIDFGFVNIKLARYAKELGWKVMYFIPPGSWRRDRQGKDLKVITDEVVTPFPWSAEMLREMGTSVHWFGHPIKQLIQGSIKQGITPGPDAPLGILPGSRLHEIESNLPVIAESIKVGFNRQLEFALAPSVDLAFIKSYWAKLAPARNDIFTVGDTYGVLQRARAAIVCSGTATLEAALCRCPSVVLYELSKSMVREAKLLRIKRPKYVSLPNIILDRDLVPELAGMVKVPPEDLRKYVDSILDDEATRQSQFEGFDELVTLLGPSDAIMKSAELALSMTG